MRPKCHQSGRFDSLDAPSRSRGFTLIELLTVIAIIMMLVALALPNFVAMMKGRRWSGAMQNIQFMVMRARALATNSRSDMSVEFNTLDNGSTLWIESECGVVETVEDLNILALQLGGGSVCKKALFYLTEPSWWIIPPGPWFAAGGRDKNPGGVEASFIPGDFVYPPHAQAGQPDPQYNGDNAKQSEIVTLSPLITIDPNIAASPHFISYDMVVGPSMPYGRDDYRDIRVSQNGALVQSIDPEICLKEIRGTERFRITVVRCTGRVMAVK